MRNSASCFCFSGFQNFLHLDNVKAEIEVLTAVVMKSSIFWDITRVVRTNRQSNRFTTAIPTAEYYNVFIQVHVAETAV
jgi:hypothetical protein